jgi:hypothetical protein
VAGAQRTRNIYQDGTNFTVFDALPNQYARVPAAPDMPGTLRLLFTRAQMLVGLDPLYFYSIGKLPKSLTGLKGKGSANLNGHPVLRHRRDHDDIDHPGEDKGRPDGHHSVHDAPLDLVDRQRHQSDTPDRDAHR